MGRKSLKPIRQTEIVKAFYRVAKAEGLENASIAKVAEVLDVNPSLVMHYFKTKKDLIHGLIEYILKRYRLIYNPENGTIDSRARLKKVVQTLFSRKWDKLFDDGVFYSSFSLIFRDKTLKSHYKKIHDELRKMLANTLLEASSEKIIKIKDVEKTADTIFIMMEGAYYYLSMVSNRAEYERKMQGYQQTVLEMLNFTE
jgi:AcrR family transcriptional regulator